MLSGETMNVNIICIGKLKEKFLKDAVAEYAKRLSAFCKFTVSELAEERLPDTPSDAQILKTINTEGERILKAVNTRDFVFAMCIEGKQLTSDELSTKLNEIIVNGSATIDFIIGGSYGLSETVKSRADFKLSMSKMTFPHQLARVMITEQIYRGFMISGGTKYHK